MALRFEPPPPPRLTGDERFVGIDAPVVDFWGYAFRDLRSNTTRGLVAEWLVTRAVGATEPLPEWHPFDVLTPSEIKVEVKSSAYLQAWSQTARSRIVFSGLTAQEWHPETHYSGERTYNADVYVFCVQTALEHDEYDPLDVRQWDFYVMSRSAVKAIGQRSLGLARVQQEAQGVAFDDLAETIVAAAARNS